MNTGETCGQVLPEKEVLISKSQLCNLITDLENKRKTSNIQSYEIMFYLLNALGLDKSD